MGRPFRPVRLVFLLLAVASTASAQQTPPTRSERPYRGLFGAGVSDAARLLVIRGSLGAGYDTNVLGGDGSGNTPVLLAAPTGTAQPYGYMSAGLTYAIAGRRASLAASLTTAGRYLPDWSTHYLASHSGTVGTSVQLSRRDRLTGTYSASLQPYTILGLGPALFAPELGTAEPVDQSIGIQQEQHWTNSGAVDYTRDIDARFTDEVAS